MKEISNVIITGVAGFIGSNLLDYLLEHTLWNITGVDNFSTGREANIEDALHNKRFAFINDSVGNLTSLKNFDVVFHLAALPRIQPSFEAVNLHINENLNISIHLIELMIKENYFPKFIFSSSSAIYGTPEKTPTNENEKIDCLSPYAFQKYEVEKYLELLSSRYPLNYVCLRYFNPYGPRSYNPENKFNAYSSVVGIFLYRYKNNLPLLVTGDGSQQRDFIHVSDLASANYSAAINTNKLNTSFNIGNGSTVSVLEVAKWISNSYEFIDKREGESEITFADITKAKAKLKWAPSHDLLSYLENIKQLS
jgi:UDP-glucose 4-epimerase